MGNGTSGMDSDWQQVLVNEKHRMKKKEREHKTTIQRLTQDIKREQDRNLKELSTQASLKREVSRVKSYFTFYIEVSNVIDLFCF